LIKACTLSFGLCDGIYVAVAAPRNFHPEQIAARQFDLHQG
jgi:hypothetical protein